MIERIMEEGGPPVQRHQSDRRPLAVIAVVRQIAQSY